MAADATPGVKTNGLAGLWRKLVEAINAPGSDDKWWVRYPLAIGILWVAWYLVEKKPQLWWLSALFVLGAAAQAREVSLVLIGLALLAAVFAGLAALPVSLAIVLGAALIAYGVYRAKDPSIDTRLPVIGKFIARRREEKATAELLNTPYFATLRTALDIYWTNEPAHAGQIGPELMESIRKQLVDEGMAIANSENPVMENRNRLAAAVAETARLQVLVMPPEPEPDSTGIRGQYGVSGELKAHLLQLATANKDLREWLHGYPNADTLEGIWDAVLARYWIVLARANVLSALRTPLDDCHTDPARDWFKPFLRSQCGRYEHDYRECLGLPSNLAVENIAAMLESMRLALFVNCVIQGARYPDLDWKDRCAEIDRAGPSD